MKQLKKEVFDFAENQMEEKVNNAENKLADIEHQIEEIYDYHIDPDYSEEKLTDLEDSWRRNNLREDSILETPGVSPWKTARRNSNKCSRRNLV